MSFYLEQKNFNGIIMYIIDNTIVGIYVSCIRDIMTTYKCFWMTYACARMFGNII